MDPHDYTTRTHLNVIPDIQGDNSPLDTSLPSIGMIFGNSEFVEDPDVAETRESLIAEIDRSFGLGTVARISASEEN
jgi:hypothetical protein